MRGLPIPRRLQLVWEDLIVPALLLSVLLGLSGVSQAQVTYDDDVLPRVFQPHCIACHGAQFPVLGIRYDTFDFATQGNNAGRAVDEVVLGTMPPGTRNDPTANQLSPELMNLMEAWQRDGFLERNQPPTNVDAGDPQSVNERTRVELNGTGSDPDGFGVTFSWSQTNGPTVPLTGADTNQASFTAPEVDAGGATLVFMLTVTDPGAGENSATDSVRITINNVNRSPMAEAGTDQPVEEGTRVDLNGSNSIDPDGDQLTYNWEQINGPRVTLSDTTVPEPFFTAPLVEVAGASLRFRLTVTDPDGLSGTDTVLINVIDSTAGGIPPRADAGPDQTVAEGALVRLNGSNSSDADGEVRSFLWTQTAGLVAALSNPTASRPTFTAPDTPAAGAMLRFDLTVTDDDGFVARDTVMVNVTDTNQPPIADAGPDQTVVEEDLVLLDGAASSDPDSTPLSFLWTQVGGPTVTLSDPMSPQPVFSAPADVAQSIVLVFQLTVTDAGGLAATDTMIINVTGINEPPVATIVGPGAARNGSIAELASVTLSGASSSDPDGTIATFTWRQTAGPAVITLSNPNLAVIQFITPEVDAAGAVLVFELMVTDDGGAAATATVTIMVENVQQPFGADDDGSTGGCTLNPRAGFDPLLPLLTALMLVFLGWQRLRRER